MVIVFFCGACRTNVIGEAVNTRLVEAGFVVADDSGRFRVASRQQAPYYYLGFGQPARARGAMAQGSEKNFSLILGELPKSRVARAAAPDADATSAGLPKLGITVLLPGR